MKNKLLILLTLMFTINEYSSESNALVAKIQPKPSDTTVLPQILGLNLNSFIGKPVDSLLLALPSNHSRRGFMFAKFGYAKGVIQAYGVTETNNCQVEIYIDNFQFLTFPNYDVSTWSITLARMELISFIRIKKSNGDICVYGCNNPNYYYLE